MHPHSGISSKFDGVSEERDVTGRPIQNGTGENEWCEKAGIRMEVFEYESGDREKWKNHSEGRRESDDHGHRPKDEVEVDHQCDSQTEEIKCASSVQSSESIGRED